MHERTWKLACWRAKRSSSNRSCFVYLDEPALPYSRNLPVWPPEISTSLILLLVVLLYKLLIVVSLFTISTASHINSLCNPVTSYTELMALRECVVVKV